MDELVNPVQSAQPPSRTTPSTNTPSQNSQNPQAPSPAPQTSTAQSLPPPQSQQAASQSPAPTMRPSTQPPAQAQSQAPLNTMTSSMPARAPPGAPGRNYLNTHLAPYLRNGMTNVLDAKPEYPLRWLGEYLISQSLIHEGGTDEKGVVERFIYEEHGVAVKRLRPESTVAVVQAADRDKDMVNGGAVNGVKAENGEKADGQNEVGGEDTEMGGS